MDKKEYDTHPVIIKAMELAEAIKDSDAYKENNINLVNYIIFECNDLINYITKLNYNSICQESGCCG